MSSALRRTGNPHEPFHYRFTAVMFAENLLDLLAEKDLLPPELLDGLRSRLAPYPRTVSATTFADRLVDEGYLTSSLASALLRQLQSASGSSTSSGSLTPSTPSMPAASRASPAGGSRGGKPKPPPLPLRPTPFLPENPRPSRPGDAPPVVSPSSGTVEQGDAEEKKFSRKKKPVNPWDTKLILFGVTGLMVLFLLGLFLTGSLVRRNADTMFAEADRAYERGAYSQAIAGYTEFLAAFPNHSGSSTARIRRALARIRVQVDTGSDWLKAFETTEAEIDSVRNVSGFFEESKAELAVLLPKIASGLATEAEKNMSLFHAERGEQMLAMIDELLPRSLRPVESLAEAGYRIERVRRNLVRDDSLHEADRELETLLATVPFGAEQLADCFETVDSLLDEYPELETDPRLIEMMKRISVTESKAVRPIPEERIPKAITGEALRDDSEPESLRSVSFYFSRQNREVSRDEWPVACLYASGSLFGLRTSDGTPLWRRSLGGCRPGTSPRIVPIPVTKSHPAASVLTADPDGRRIERRNAENGDLLWRLPIGEEFYLSEVVVDPETSSPTIAIATRSGRLLVVSFGFSDGEHSDRIVGVRLPQGVDSAPLVDPMRGCVYQLAARNTLYRFSPKSPDEVRSYFIGQKPSTVRTAPVALDSHLLIVRLVAPRRCEGIVFSEDRGDVVQRIPIPGLVDAPVASDKNFYALIADNGETMLLEKSDDATTPLRVVAQGSAGRSADSHGTDSHGNDLHNTVRYVVLNGRTVWVADRQLMKFETLLPQSRLLPKESLRQDIVTPVAPWCHSRTLFHPFRQVGRGGSTLEAVSLAESATLWETEVADPIVFRSPSDDSPEAGWTFYTSGGKAYRLDPNQNEVFSGTPTAMLPPGTFGPLPLGNVVALRDGFSAWIPKFVPDGGRLIMMFDPGAPEATRFRSLLLPHSIAASPIPFNGHLLVPLTDGTVVLVDARSRESVSSPFVPPLIAGKPPAWSSPVPSTDSGEFLIVNNVPDDNGETALYRIALQTEGDRRMLVLRKSVTLDAPVSIRPVVFGDRCILIDERKTLYEIRPGARDEEMNIVKTETLAAAPVWGPCLCNGYCLFATADSKLHLLSPDGKSTSISSPIPVGDPFSDRDGILLNSGDGAVWKLDPEKPEILFLRETGVRTRVGPVRIERRIVMAGEDGNVYFIDIPEK